jgi:hypothetical protein
MVGFIVILLIVPVLDWLAVTRLAAYYTDFDYRYWPPTLARIASVVFVITAYVPCIVFADPDNPPLWVLIPVTASLTIWGVVAVSDVRAQRKTGYRTPPNYGDRDYD